MDFASWSLRQVHDGKLGLVPILFSDEDWFCSSGQMKSPNNGR